MKEVFHICKSSNQLIRQLACKSPQISFIILFFITLGCNSTKRLLNKNEDYFSRTTYWHHPRVSFHNYDLTTKGNLWLTSGARNGEVSFDSFGFRIRYVSTLNGWQRHEVTRKSPPFWQLEYSDHINSLDSNRFTKRTVDYENGKPFIMTQSWPLSFIDSTIITCGRKEIVLRKFTAIDPTLTDSIYGIFYVADTLGLVKAYLNSSRSESTEVVVLTDSVHRAYHKCIIQNMTDPVFHTSVGIDEPHIGWRKLKDL